MEAIHETGAVTLPHTVTGDLWAERFDPIPNPDRLGQGFDFGQGSCWYPHTDLLVAIQEHKYSTEQIWTIEKDTDSVYWLHHGIVNVPRNHAVTGYMITKHVPAFDVDYPIVVEA
jgi:hypothetical protein